MDCNEARQWIGADADGELEASRHDALQRHVCECPTCRALFEHVERRSTQLAAIGRFRAPADLEQSVRSAIAAERSGLASGASTPVLDFATTPRKWAPARPWWAAVGIAASVAVAAWVGSSWGEARATRAFWTAEAITDHVRSLQVDHLTDVTSTDRHTVKPWFAGKLDFSPPVVDLAESGFPLFGGRLDRLHGRTVAALVYHRRQHAINVFIWPTTSERISAHEAQRDGYNVVGWSDATFNFIAVSEIPADELGRFAGMLRERTK